MTPATHLRSFVVLAAAAAVLAAGCAGRSRMVRIDSTPEGSRGASIYINGKLQGTTKNDKVRVEFGSPDQRVLLQIVKNGFVPVSQYWGYEEVPEKVEFKMEEE